MLAGPPYGHVTVGGAPSAGLLARSAPGRSPLSGGGPPGAAAESPASDPAGTGTIRVLIVDDHPAMRMGLRASLDREPGLAVVGEAASGEEAIAVAQRVRPTVVLMDLLMPGLNGLDATRAIKRAAPGASVIILTALLDEENARAALEAGASAYVQKGAALDELRGSVRAVASRSVRLPAAARGPVPDPPFGLTPRELDVLRELAGGRTNKEIARTLGVTLETTKTYVKRVLLKLGVQNRTEAAILAVADARIRTALPRYEG